MKPIYRLSLLLIILGGFQWASLAQNLIPKPVNRLTHEMTPEEAARKHEIGKDFKGTNPPPGDIRNIAEYEKMQGVLIRYPFGIPYTLIAGLSDEINVTTIVASQSEKNYVISQYTANGVNLTNCDFLIAPSDSYWTRDYGPWFITYGNDQIGIIDFVYNRPRPMDDLIPQHLADFLGIDWFGMEIIHTGGNYMTDAYNVSSSTTLVWNENPSITHAQLNDSMHIFLGINQYHVVEDPNNTYIDHIDCWGKFLGPSKVLIRSVPTTHPQYDEIEATAAYYASQTSGYGIPYQIFRVYTPNNQPYTNSLICNDRVFVPITGSQWDDEALASYEEAMPGYEVLGFTGSWESTDALHCRVIGIADREMVFISHLPLLGEQEVNPSGYQLNAAITAYSLESVANNSVKIFYSVNGGSFSEITMTHLGGKNYTGTIPQQAPGSTVSYYIHAEDVAGNSIDHPFIGQPDPHVFTIGTQMPPNIALDVTQINTTCPAGNIITDEFNISNTGLASLDFSLEVSVTSLKSHEYNVTHCSQYGTDDAFVLDITDEGSINSLEIQYNWSTDLWPEEGSFFLESPSGTKALLAAGTLSGTFYFEPASFRGEELKGPWKLWIEDAGNDGGHAASDIRLVFKTDQTKTDWLDVEPENGIITAGGQQMITVSSDATQLTEGTYLGNIKVLSNDPDQPEIDIPVTFTVNLNTGIGLNPINGNEFSVSPNPLNSSARFNCNLEKSTWVVIEIYNAEGQKVKNLFSGILSQGINTIVWNRESNNNTRVKAGIYVARIMAGEKSYLIKMVVNE